MEKKPLSRKERERLRHRQEILDKALKLFTEQGFHNVSMQQIAVASEFAVGTLYNFFESKEALFEELIKSSGERIIDTLMVIVDSPGIEVDRLTRFIRYTPTLLEENAAFIKLYVAELGTRAAKLSSKRDKENYDAVLKVKLEQLIEDGTRQGVFRPVDPTITIKALISTIETLAFEIADQFDKAAATEIFDKVEQLFIGGLLKAEGQGNDT